MPQASEEQRAYWGGISEQPAIQHLKSRGFVLLLNWTWRAPEKHIYSARDLNALSFLIDEWDFGGVSEGPLPLEAESLPPYHEKTGLWVD